MNYQDTARQIIDRIGGKENVLSLFHCITRLRFLLKDNDKADRAALEALDGVMGVNISGDQFQLIIGNDVEPLCKALLAVLPDLDNAARPTKRRNPVSVVLEGLSSIFFADYSGHCRGRYSERYAGVDGGHAMGGNH